MLVHKIQGKCQNLKGCIREAWGRALNDNETLEKGKRDQFFGKFRAKYGITKEQAKERIRKFEEESNTARV